LKQTKYAAVALFPSNRSIESAVLQSNALIFSGRTNKEAPGLAKKDDVGRDATSPPDNRSIDSASLTRENDV